MARQTSTVEQRERADRKLIKRLQGRKTPVTAATLGTTAAHLRELGAVEAGRVQTGKAGRPAILFVWPEGQEQS